MNKVLVSRRYWLAVALKTAVYESYGLTEARDLQYYRAHYPHGT